MPCPVKHQVILLFKRLGWYEPHIGPADSLIDGLGVSHVVLMTLDVM